jgi:uncharacterized repeat protein (TIGR03803 family)
MRFVIFALATCVPLCAKGAVSPTFTTLVRFTGTGGTASGANPYGSLIASGSTLYGMTNAGGANGAGNVFSVGVNGTNYQNMVSFTGTGGTASGLGPYGSLIASGATLYGMTYGGGASGNGNIFSVGTNGANYQNLVSFTGNGGTANGKYVWYGDSLLAIGGTLYGMTYEGGTNRGGYGIGNIFSVSANGTNFQNLVSFTGSSGTASGADPPGSLIAIGGTLYGMTASGGAGGNGNIFSVGTNGTNFQNLVSFTGSGGTANGDLPFGSLTASGSTLYGMTYFGGANGEGNVFSVGVNGTNFQNLLSFTGSGSSGTANGAYPYGSLILSGTSLYGMTSAGGAHGVGNIFSVGVDGSGYQDLYDFTGGADGGDPYGGLVASGGTLFGMTNDIFLPAGGNGTIFALAGVLPTPEPGTLALVGCGAAALISYRWRQRRKR